MNCKDIENLLQLYHDGELDEAQRKETERHLAECQKCREKLAELSALDALLIDGNAEKVPDPGDHYWQNFSFRVHRRLGSTTRHLIRPHHHVFRFRLLPYLSAAAAVIIALIVSLPLLKQAPAKFSEKEISEFEKVPSEPAKGFVRSDVREPIATGSGIIAPGEPLSEQGLGSANDISTVRTRTPAPSDFKDEEADRAAAPRELEEPTAAPKTTGKAASSKEKSDIRRPQEGASAERKAPAKAEATAGGVTSSEEMLGESAAWSFDRQFASETPQPGTLRVVIDSTGQLASVTVYRSSGDPKADSLAVEAYKKQWQGRVFRQRQADLYVPFGQDTNN